MHPATFIKFGAKEHIESLLNEGLIFMNTLKFFREVEDGNVRGDRYDGASEIQRGTKASVKTLDGTELGANVVSWELGIFPTQDVATNIFSLFVLSSKSYPVCIDVLDFGDYAFVLSDPDEFIARLKKTLRNEKLTAHAGLVTYIDDNHTGTTDVFKKRESFSWQHEWRLQILGGDGSPRSIRLGSLSDIGFICPADDINRKITLTP